VLQVQMLQPTAVKINLTDFHDWQAAGNVAISWHFGRSEQ